MRASLAPAAAPLRAALFLLALLFACALAWAQSVLPVPPLSGRVIDQTGTLTAQQVTALDAKLAAIETQHGSQVVVLMVPTARPEDIAAFAQRVASTWKIGRKEVGDGLLLTVATSTSRSPPRCRARSRTSRPAGSSASRSSRRSATATTRAASTPRSTGSASASPARACRSPRPRAAVRRGAPAAASTCRTWRSSSSSACRSSAGC
jgi:hypothetical protein